MMKKTLLLIGFVAMLGITNVLGQTTEAIDISAQGFGNAEDLGTITQGDVTLTFDSGGGQNPPKYYTTGAAARFYAKNTLTVEAGGQTITNVVFTLSSGGDAPSSSNPSYDSGTLTIDNNTRMTWTGSSDEVMIANTATKGHFRIQSVTVTYGSSVSTTPNPVIDGATSFVGSTTVTITDTDPTAAIYYTVDGSAPSETSTLYAAPFTLDATTTVNAMAIINGVSSAVVKKVFTLVQAISVAEANTLVEASGIDGQPVVSSGAFLALNNAQVVAVIGSNIFLREGDKAIMLFDASGLSLATNDMVSGTVSGNLVSYFGIPEMSGVTSDMSSLTVTAGTEATPNDVTVADILGLQHRSDFVRLTGVTITTDGSNFYAVSGTDKIQLYSVNPDNTAAILAGFDTTGATQYDITAVFNNIYHGAPEVAPIEITPYDPTGISAIKNGNAGGKDAPVFNLAGQRVNPNTKGLVIKNGKKLIVK